MPDNSSENQKVITFAQFKYAIDRLVQNNHGVINDLKFKVGEESTGVTVTESDDSEFIITRTDSEDVTHVLTLPVVGNRTVATLEDDDQEMHMKQWNYGEFFVTFPGIELPVNVQNNSNYLGQMLTSRTFGFEEHAIATIPNGLSGQSPIWPGFINRASGTSFSFVPKTDSIRSLDALTFLDLNIRGDAGTEVEIEFSGFQWPNGMPVWSESLGCHFLIMILGRACFVISRTLGSGSGIDGVKMSGNIDRAKQYATTDNYSNTPFQWLLVQDDGQGFTVTKPIWYTGDGRFIDAYGSLIAEL